MIDQQKTKSENDRAYLLCACILDENPELSLDEEEFKNLGQAKTCLNAALALEENYDLLLSNYRELEMEAISAAVANMTAVNDEYEDFFEVRTAINRRVVNLLSASRMYVDQFAKNLKRIGVDPAEAKAVCSKVYDDFFEYRFMEALRNHAQHAGLAVHAVTRGKRWLPSNAPQHLQSYVNAYTLKSALKENPDFKKTVLDECPEKIAIVPAARIHLGGISSVHKKVRELIAPLVADARFLFEATIARHENLAQRQYSGLSAIAKEEGVIVEKIPILLDWDDVRQKLLERNHPVENLAKRFVTTQADEY